MGGLDPPSPFCGRHCVRPFAGQESISGRITAGYTHIHYILTTWRAEKLGPLFWLCAGRQPIITFFLHILNEKRTFKPSDWPTGCTVPLSCSNRSDNHFVWFWSEKAFWLNTSPPHSPVGHSLQSTHSPHTAKGLYYAQPFGRRQFLTVKPESSFLRFINVQLRCCSRDLLPRW